MPGIFSENNLPAEGYPLGNLISTLSLVLPHQGGGDLLDLPPWRQGVPSRGRSPTSTKILLWSASTPVDACCDRSHSTPSGLPVPTRNGSGKSGRRTQGGSVSFLEMKSVALVWLRLSLSASHKDRTAGALSSVLDERPNNSLPKTFSDADKRRLSRF